MNEGLAASGAEKDAQLSAFSRENEKLKHAVLEKEAALKRSEERLSRMVEEIEDYAIFTLDTDGIIQSWNKGAEKIKGYTEAEVTGHHFRIFYQPEDVATKLPEQLLEEASRVGKVVREGWRRRKDGQLFWSSVVITALHNDAGAVIGFTKVTRDLTERKKNEEALLQSARLLAAQNRELEQFAYIAAHDLKEPARKLEIYSRYLSEVSGPKLSEKERQYLDKSVATAKRMQQLVDNLLIYSQISNVNQFWEPVNLSEVLHEILTCREDEIKQLQAEIRVTSLPVITAVRFQMHQLFENLISNALKYRRTDVRPSITVDCQKETDITGTDPNERYRITVTDNGIGFKQEHATKIFSLFERLHNKEEYPGTGIGLATCYNIVQKHNGEIYASGDPGSGARFTVLLRSEQLTH